MTYLGDLFDVMKNMEGKTLLYEDDK